MLGVGGVAVAARDRRLEALEVRLHGAREEAVLVVLAQGAGVALSL